jgi:hypothetical protein
MKLQLTESQYRRLFLFEQSNLEAERNKSWVMYVPAYGKNYKGITADWLEKNLDKFIISQEQGDTFRKWVNKVYPDYAKENDLDETGSYNNAYVKKAWKDHGFEFMLNHKISTMNPFTKEKIDPPVYLENTKRYRSISTQKDIDTRKANSRLLLDRNKSNEDWENFFKNYKYTGEESGSGGGNVGKTPEEILKFQNQNLKSSGLPSVSKWTLKKAGFLPHDLTKLMNESSWMVFKEVEEYKSNFGYGAQSCRYIWSKDISNKWKGSQGGVTGPPIVISNFNTSKLKKLSDDWARTPDTLEGSAKWLSYWLIADFYFDRWKFEEKTKKYGDVDWWNFLNELYGTADPKVIKSNISIANSISGRSEFQRYRKCTIRSKDPLKAAVGAFENVLLWAMDCASDYHCMLEVASVVALAIPGAGLWISAGLDLANATSYYVEASMTDDPLEKKMLMGAGTMSLFGVIPVVGETKVFLKGTNPKILKFSDDFVETVAKKSGGNKTLKTCNKNGICSEQGILTRSEIDKIFQEKIKQHGLSADEIKVASDYFNELGKVSKSDVKKYINTFNELSKKINIKAFHRLNKTPKFQKILKSNNGDMLKSLNQIRKSPEWKAFLTQIGLFTTGEIVIPQTLQPAIEKAVKGGKFGIRYRVQSAGYDWEDTKKAFGSSDSKSDNEKLELAWMLGWRPDKNGGIVRDAQLQTDLYKKGRIKKKKQAKEVLKGLEGWNETVKSADEEIKTKITPINIDSLNVEVDKYLDEFDF